MVKKFKNKLIGERIVLKRTLPSLDLAKNMFEVIDKNRAHLASWMEWEKFTKKIEDTYRYLIEKEKEENEGKKLEYGIYVNKEYVGKIGIFDIDQKNKLAEIGYWISKDFTKKGYMTEAVKLLEKEFFENFKLNRIQIKCDEKNLASAGVVKKCGYILEGKNRKNVYVDYYKDFRDTLVFSKLKEEYLKN